MSSEQEEGSSNTSERRQLTDDAVNGPVVVATCPLLLFSALRGGVRALALMLVLQFVCGGAEANGAELRTRFTVRDGYIAVDPKASRLELGEHAAAYESCGLTRETVQSELITFIDTTLKLRGKVLDQLALDSLNLKPGIEPRAAVEVSLRDLMKSDRNTSELYSLNETWEKAEPLYRSWMELHINTKPAVRLSSKVLGADIYQYIFMDPAWADGPVLPPKGLYDYYDDKNRNAIKFGDAVFELAPPFINIGAKLKPTLNAEEWDKHRSELADDLLATFSCKLWYRNRIVERAKDYLEMRGISARGYRTTRDERDAHGTVKADAEPPVDAVGIAPERPDFLRVDFGGRVLLSPDPLVDFIIVELDYMRHWPMLRRILYLLLPTRDWNKVIAKPDAYLCRMVNWKPAVEGSGASQAVRLALTSREGAQLGLAHTYLTRRLLAERLQRLGSVSFESHVAFPTSSSESRRKAASLVVEQAKGSRQVPLAEVAGPAIPPCIDTSARPQRGSPTSALSLSENADIVQPNRPESNGTQLKEQPRHDLILGLESGAGKPPRYSAEFSRKGLTNEDTLTLRAAQQDQSSGEVKYSRDFFGFDRLDRRVQLSVRAFSEFSPKRATQTSPADERRVGTDVRATVDLWRDRAGSFAQLDLGGGQHDVTIQDANPATTRVTQLEMGLNFGRSLHGTPASEHLEGSVTLAYGRVNNGGGDFTKLGADTAYRRFLGAFTQWDLRANAHHIGGKAPSPEWPIFGGDDSVRGYRADTAIARSTWVIQNEFWTPLSGLAGGNEDLAKILRRSVALAVFADVGGLKGSPGTVSGSKLGVGVGIRYNMSDNLVLRLDWARAINENPLVASRSGYFYLTISSRRTL